MTFGTFDEVFDYLETVFGTDRAFGGEQRNDEGYQIVPLLRKSDKAYLGYVASCLKQRELGEEINPEAPLDTPFGEPYLEIRVYLEMTIVKDYMQPRGNAA